MHAVGNKEYWLIQTGMGLQNAHRSALQILHGRSFSLMVSTGFACALRESRIGGLLVGQEAVYMGGHGATCSKAIDVPGDARDAMMASITAMEPSAQVGRFVSTDQVVGRASEKARFATDTHAIGLDMESWALAEEAHRARVPFVIIRSVSDLVDEDLPLDFNLFLRPTGWLKGIGTVLAAPTCLLGLGRLRRQSLVAAEALTAIFRSYAAAMESGQKNELSPT